MHDRRTHAEAGWHGNSIKQAQSQACASQPSDADGSERCAGRQQQQDGKFDGLLKILRLLPGCTRTQQQQKADRRPTLDSAVMLCCSTLGHGAQHQTQ